jgi:hypothetical protein
MRPLQQAGGWRMTACSAVALLGLAGRTEFPAARVMPAGGVNDNRAGRRVHSAASDRRRENNDGNQCFHGAALVDEMAFSLCGSGLATEEEARLALPQAMRTGRRPLERPVRLASRGCGARSKLAMLRSACAVHLRSPYVYR